MPFHVRDPETDRAVRRLARLTGKTLTATIREAVEHEYEAVAGRPSLIEKIKAIQEAARKLRRPGGLPADKPFYDDLSGDL